MAGAGRSGAGVGCGRRGTDRRAHRARSQGRWRRGGCVEGAGRPRRTPPRLRKPAVRRPGARSHGVAHALMTEAVAAARVRDWQLVLDVLEKDRAAIRLYERMGWVRIGRLTHEFGDGERAPALAYAL